MGLGCRLGGDHITDRLSFMLSHRSNKWAWSLLGIIASMLVGCEQAVPLTPPTTATPPAPTVPLVVDTATPPPVADTAVPTPPTAPTAALVDPEWQIAFTGDLNRDGRQDVVNYKLATVTPDPALGGTDQPLTLAVTEALIVQEDAQGQLQTQASITAQGVQAADVMLLSAADFGEAYPAAFLMEVDPQAEVVLSFIPLNADGMAYAQGFGLYWNEGQLAYRLFAHGQPVPPPDIPPGSTLPLTPAAPALPPPSEMQAPDQ